jgi:hypothetical protein
MELLDIKSLGKKNCTKSYLHVDSHHHPSQKIEVLNTLVMRVMMRILDVRILSRRKTT